jgi:ubiquinone/menaquinone biosynthesis C-methylase UbiE
MSDMKLQESLETHKRYGFALGFRFMTVLYDPLIRWFLREGRIKGELVSGAGLRSGDAILDIGCGTGTLAQLVAAKYPLAKVTGIDGDVDILEIARKKATNACIEVRYDFGFSTSLPYPEKSFDHVFSSLMFHHLTRDQKNQSLNEIHRVLRAGGHFHLCDFSGPQSRLMRVMFTVVRCLDGFSQTEASARGEYPDLMTSAGFSELKQKAVYETLLGTIRTFEATKPIVNSQDES